MASGLCYDSCTITDENNSEKQIYCVTCMKPFHFNCANNLEKAKLAKTNTHFTCISCRKVPFEIHRIYEELKALQGQYNNLMQLYTDRVNICDSLQKQVAVLMENNAKLNGQLDLLKYVNAKDGSAIEINKPTKERLVIGSSIVKDMGDTENVEISVNRGCGIEKIGEALFKKDVKSYKEITLQAGTIDCANTGANSEDIMTKYRKLVEDVEDKMNEGTKIRISSILPQTRDENVQVVIEEINAKLYDYCRGKPSIQFIDNDSSFKSRDNKVIKSMNYDGLHLSEPGTKTLMENLKLPEACFQPENGKGRHYMQHGSQHSRGKCFNCGVTGHTRNQCRHRRAVQCYNCHGFGHKAYYCQN